MVLAYHNTYGVDALITRCSNNFGSYQFPEKLIPHFVLRLLNNQKLPLYGDGKNIRDWLHVDDHCDAILKVLLKGESGEVYNIGGNNEWSNYDITQTILNEFNLDNNSISYVDDRLGHDRRYAIDASKIIRELNWHPCITNEQNILSKTIVWYIKNLKWLNERWFETSHTSLSS